MLPTTKLYRLNLRWFIDHALNPKIWGKKFPIFEYDKLTVCLSLDTINASRRTISLLVTATFTNTNLQVSSYDLTQKESFTLPWDLEQHNEQASKRTLVAIVRNNIRRYERAIARTFLGYKRAFELDKFIEQETEARAIALLDDQGIQHIEVREAYIQSCRDKIITYHSFQFLQQAEYRTQSHYYLMLYSFFYPEDKEAYQTAIDLIGKDTGIRVYKQYAKDIKAYLKAVYEDDVETYLQNMEMDLDTL